jgi:hypothetical protein
LRAITLCRSVGYCIQPHLRSERDWGRYAICVLFALRAATRSRHRRKGDAVELGWRFLIPRDWMSKVSSINTKVNYQIRAMYFVHEKALLRNLGSVPGFGPQADLEGRRTARSSQPTINHLAISGLGHAALWPRSHYWRATPSIRDRISLSIRAIESCSAGLWRSERLEGHVKNAFAKAGIRYFK